MKGAALAANGTTMEIWIETARVVGSDGMARHYFAEPHFTIDEKDTITPDTMRIVCDRLSDTLNDCFKAAEIEKEASNDEGRVDALLLNVETREGEDVWLV